MSQVLRGQSQGSWSSFTLLWLLHPLQIRALTGVTPSPAFLVWKDKESLFLPGHVVGASRENRVQGQKRQSHFACFLNYTDSLKQMWNKWSFLLPGQISCHVSMPKPGCIICLAIMQTTSSQAENKAQLDVGTRRQWAKIYPNRKTPRVHNLNLFVNVLTFSNGSIAFSGCFLISVLKYFNCN